MKNYYLTILLTLLCAFSFAQNNDFTNGGGDFLWSNAANWSLGVVPNTTNTGIVRVTLPVESLVDVDVTIKKIQNSFGTAVDTPVAGNSILTIDPGANAVYGIENVSDSDVNLIFKGKVTINNTAGVSISNTLMRNTNGNSNDVNGIVFDSGSVLTLNTPLEARAGTGGAVFNFNGNLAGTAPVRVSANATCVFGSTSDNSGFDGDFVFVGAGGAFVVDTADNTTFLPSGHKFQVNANNVSAEINGANVIQGNFVVGGSNTLSIDFNKDQGNMGFVSFPADGTLNLNIDNSVANLSFANCSEEAWNAGTLNISGFTEGVVRFGTDNTGLTAGQLSQITADNGGEPVALDSNGYLVNASSLSTNDFDKDTLGRISYPTLTDNKIFFKKPQENLKIFDLNGRMVIEKQSDNQTEIEVKTLNKGLYFIVFANNKVEKFIKQ